MLAAVVLAGAAAGGAVLLLAPADGQLISPEPVGLRTAFAGALVDRNRAFGRPQLLIGLLALAVQVLVLLRLTLRPPARLRAMSPTAAGAALAGVAVSAAVSLAVVPLAALGRGRALHVGLSTQSWLGWAGDRLLSMLIAAGLAAIAGVIVLSLVRRLPRRWWLLGAAAAPALAAAVVFVAPLTVDRVFNRFTPLAPGPLRADVMVQARRAGVQVGSIEVMDASRRTTGVNAYVAGLGSSKRIVVYDTLLRDFTPAQMRSVLAHELAHQRFGDLRGGILFIGIIAPFGMFAVAALAGRLTRVALGHPASLPALALALLLVSTGIGWISNSLSRDVERRADAWALRSTRDPAAFAALQRDLVRRNRSDPSPPALVSAVLATHPSALERIGMAAAVADRQR